MGLAGIGALGVAFGSVVAMDSPSARGPQGFHWASTLWHEMAHVVHLGMTEHRVPRWLTEGLAVHEERRAGVAWGMRPSLSFFAAYIEGRLRPPSELSQSFVRPRFPEEVGFAYILGSLVARWAEEVHGFDAILEMLAEYRDGRGPEEVARRVFGQDLAGVDHSFDDWFQDRYSQPLAAARAALELRALPPQTRTGDRAWLERRVQESPTDVESRMALARVLIAEEEYEAAIRPLTEARDIFPENPDPSGPSRLLARVHSELGDDAAAARTLRTHLANVSGDYAAHLELAGILEEEGDVGGAVETLEEAIYVYPFEIQLHERLAGLYRRTEDPDGEIRERRVLLALGPPDRAGALHALAESQFRAGRLEESRANVLRALELAPRYPEAQDLLLRIVGSDPGGAR
jgi:tetratricopeptide (TPR) repeat protein